jgi:hypothetical protein
VPFGHKKVEIAILKFIRGQTFAGLCLSNWRSPLKKVYASLVMASIENAKNLGPDSSVSQDLLIDSSFVHETVPSSLSLR